MKNVTNILIFLIIGFVAGYIVSSVLQGDNNPSMIEEDNGSDVITTEPFELLKNSEITVPDMDKVVNLNNGEAKFEIVPGAASQGSVTIIPDKYAKWSENSRTDLASIIVVNTGGTGMFYYLILFDASSETLVQKSYLQLGDRIAVESIGIGELVHDPDADYRISVNTLIRDEGESFATPPTIAKTRTFYVANQVLEEVDVGLDDT